jgi:hypothetical protein
LANKGNGRMLRMIMALDNLEAERNSINSIREMKIPKELTRNSMILLVK